MLHYLGDVSEDIGVEGEVVFGDVEVSLQQDVGHQSAGISYEGKRRTALMRWPSKALRAPFLVLTQSGEKVSPGLGFPR